MKSISHEAAQVFDLVMDQMNAGFIWAEYPSGKLVKYNSASEAILGHPVIQTNDVDGYITYGGYHLCGKKYVAEEYPTARALLHGEVVTNEKMIYQTPTGERKYLSVNASPIVKADGSRIGAVCIFHDITESERKLHSESKFLGQIGLLMDKSPHAIALFDETGRYIHINEKLERLHGLAAKDHLGKRITDIFPQTGWRYDSIIAKVLQTKEAETDITEEFVLNYQRVILRSSFFPVQLDQEVVGVGAFIEDVTASVNSDERKKEELNRIVWENEQITNFVNVLSHDIRNPLTAIKMNSQLIPKYVNKNEKLCTTAQKIESLANKIHSLISDVLDANLVRRGVNFSFEKEPMNVNKVLSDVVDQQTSIHGGIIFLEQRSKKFGSWNPRAVERIADNLVTNAIKYRDPKTSVLVMSYDEGDYSVIEVKNFGPEIPFQKRQEIFQPFKRLGNAETGETKSYGLGLSIVKGLVDAHAGKIEVRSAEDTGTIFRVYLPLN